MKIFDKTYRRGLHVAAEEQAHNLRTDNALLRDQRDRQATLLAWLCRDLAMIIDSDVPTTEGLRELLHYYYEPEIRGPMCDRLPEPTSEGEAKG